MRSRDELIRDTEPFPSSVIEYLPPRNDAYVSWYQYAERLLLYYGGYSWEPGDPIHSGDVWTVRGVLTIAGERYGAVGEDRSPTSAESNAFKRACARAGIGLHLYDEKFWLHNRLKREDSSAGMVSGENPERPSSVHETPASEYPPGQEPFE